MKTNEDYKRLSRLRHLEDYIKVHLAGLIAVNRFPPYYDNWCRRLARVGDLIVELKYK